MKKLIFLILTLIPALANSQIEQVWKTDYQITSDTFNTFGYKTDSAGNFYLYGWHYNRVFLQKHNSNGLIEWTINDTSIVGSLNFNGNIQAVSNTRITDIAFDPELNIYVAGISSQENFGNPNYSSYFFVSKMLPDGRLAWKRNFSTEFDSLGGTVWNYSCNIQLLKSDNSLIVSYGKSYWPIFCNGQYDIDFGIVKIDTSGKTLWNRSFIGDSNICSKDIITSMSLYDTLIIFSGFSTAPSTEGSKLVTFSLNKNGTLADRQEEKQSIADPYSDQPLNLYLPESYTSKVQSNGSTTYITVESSDSTNQNKRSLLVLKYDNNLNRVWRYDLSKDSSVTIEVEMSVVDDSCNLLVSSIWKENGVTKGLFLRLDSSGNEQYRDTFSNGVEANLCFINKNSEYILLTSSSIGSLYSSSVRKYYPFGELAWDSTLTIPGKILHGWVDSSYCYLVLRNDLTLSYIKFKDKDLSVGLKRIIQNQPIIYPNPVNDILYIKYHSQESQSCTYRIYNQAGELISSGETTLNGIPVAGLIPGMYFLTLIDNSTSSAKFIKK